MKKKFSVRNIILAIISLFLALIFIMPIIWSLAVSFKTEGTPIKNTFDWFKPPYTLENYPRIIFDTSVPIWLLNSIFVAVAVTVLVLIFTAMAAYAIAKVPCIGKNAIFFFFLIGLMVPGEATIVPLFITAKDLNIIDTYGGLIFPSIAISMNIVIMVSFFRGIPGELVEAASIDGAGPIRIFVSLMLPLSKTVLVTVGIFSFIGSWNNYLWPLLSAMSESMFTLPVGIPTFVGMYTVDYVMPLTSNMVASIPTIIIFLFLEKHIVKGVSLSGIKG